MEKLIQILQNNPRLSNQDIAVMLDMSEENVAKKIAEYEKSGIVSGYKAIIDWDKLDDQHVTALIEIRVTPQSGYGFDEIAQKIAQFKEVESVYLMSGAYDLAVMLTGKTFQEVAMFVARRLSPLDSVISTATHFILRRYKDVGVVLRGSEDDDRGLVLL